jgi:hypothetical protein
VTNSSPLINHQFFWEVINIYISNMLDHLRDICYIEKVFEWLLEQLKWKKKRNCYQPHKETASKILTQGLTESPTSKHRNGVSTESLWQYPICIGEGHKYRPFRDLRSLPEAGRPREHVENHGRTCTQVFFLCKADLGFFHFLEIVTGWLVPSAR